MRYLVTYESTVSTTDEFEADNVSEVERVLMSLEEKNRKIRIVMVKEI